MQPHRPAISPAAMMVELPGHGGVAASAGRIAGFAGWSADELLAAFRHRSNQAAFEEVVRRYSAMVLATCMGVSRNRHDAEDAAQATFLTLAMQMRQGKEVRAIGPWLQQVARRVSLDQRKSAKRRTRREEIHSAEWLRQGTEQQRHEQETIHDVGDLKRVLSEELETLPPKYKLPLILHFYGGLSREQMSRELGCKAATLGVRIFRAKEMLGRRLAARGVMLDGVSLDGSGAGGGTLGCVGVGGAVLSVVLGDVVRSSVSDALVRQTVEVASHLSAGTAYPGVLSLGVMDLAERAVSTLALARLRGIIAAALIGSGGLAGAVPFVQDVDFDKLIPAMISAPLEGLRELIRPELPVPTLLSVPQMLTQAPELPSKPQPIMAATELNLRAVDVPVNTATAKVPTADSSFGTTGRSLANTAKALPSASAAMVSLPSATATTTAMPAIVRPEVSRNVEAGVGGVASGGMVASAKNMDHPRPGDQVAFVLRDADGTSSVVLAAINEAFAGGLAIRPGQSALMGLRPPRDLAANSQVALAGGAPMPPVNLIADVENGAVTAIRGHGTVALGGVLDQSGTVVADGFGQARELSFVTSAVTNSIENPPAGSAGWYAMNGGKLVLPPQLAAVPSGSITWGEDAADRQIDLVNSLRLSIGGVTNAGDVAISLLPVDGLGERSLAATPETTALAMLSQPVVSAYAVDFGEVEASRVSFAARFDPALLEEMTGTRLAGISVWAFDDGAWQKLNNTWLDRQSRIISGSIFLSGFEDRSFELLALTLDGRTTIREAQAGLWSNLRIGSAEVERNEITASGAGSVFVPEPAGLAVLGLGGMLAMRRRRATSPRMPA
jgi:RNA polymerase sigma factor (sigma-70 family)